MNLAEYKNKIIMGISIPITLSLIYFVWGVAQSHVMMNLDTAALAAANAKALQEQQSVPEQLTQIQGAMNEIFKEITTVEGLAKVGTFGSDEEYIQVNRLGKASRYVKSEKARVTNLDSEDRHSKVLPVSGTYSDPNPDCIIKVSQRAAQDLVVTGGSFRVQIQQPD